MVLIAKKHDLHTKISFHVNKMPTLCFIQKCPRTYKKKILNASKPVLGEQKKLIPVFRCV